MGYMRENGRKVISRIGVSLTGMLCAVLLMLVVPAKDVFAYEEGTVTASSANIRSSADASSTVLASVLQGDELTIIESVTGTDGKVWYKVFIDANSQGYIRSDLISTSGGNIPTVTPKPADDTPTLNTNVTINMDGVEAVQPVGASVTKDNVRVRADSTTDSSIVTTVREDAALTVHGTKPGSNNEVWYQVSFLVDGTEVNGYVRSDFVTLNGELLPVVDTPAEPEVPGDTTTEQPVEPEEPVVENKHYDTAEEDGVWKLIDNEKGSQYPIEILIESSEKNADLLEQAQKKISRQTGIIIFLVILVVIAVLAITVLIFKLRDMLEDDGLDFKSAFLGGSGGGNSQRSSRTNGNNRLAGSSAQGNRPTGSRPAGGSAQGNRPTGSRPAGSSAQGNRPAGSRPAGSRPAGSSAQGNRPTGSRPAGSSAQGNRPAGSRPAGSTSQGAKLVEDKTRVVATSTTVAANREMSAGSSVATEGARPATTRPSEPVYEGTLEKQARADVESRNLEQVAAENRTHQARNFMVDDDDEFEFEFLNWDGTEEK